MPLAVIWKWNTHVQTCSEEEGGCLNLSLLPYREVHKSAKHRLFKARSFSFKTMLILCNAREKV